MGVINSPLRCLPSHPHPSNLQEVPTVHLQVSNLPVHLSPNWASYGPTSFHNDSKGSESYRTQQGSQTPITRRGTTEEIILNLTQSLGWVINRGKKSKLTPTQVFSFMGYEYNLDSSFVKATQDRGLKLQDLILKIKPKMFDVANWDAHLSGEDGPGRLPSQETLSVAPQGELELSSVAGHPPFFVERPYRLTWIGRKLSSMCLRVQSFIPKTTA